MITAIIETRNDEVGLAHTLAALVPAATEGVIRQVVIIDRGSSDGTLTVADAAGCTIIDAGKIVGDPRHVAAEAARGDWLLFLSPSARLSPGWQGDAMAFIDHALVTGRARSRIAYLHRGGIAHGWWGRIRAALAKGDGRLVAKAAYLAASASSSSPLSAASPVSGARRGAA